MKAPRSLVLLVLATAAAGCQDPYQQQLEHDRTEQKRQYADPPHLPGAADASSSSAATPRSVVTAFCARYANWSWKNIGRQQRQLARLASGALARELLAEASTRADDRVLRRDRLGGRGRVVAVDVKPGRAERRAVCVAWEEPIADGHANSESARHHIYLATVTQTTGHWAITQWEPQP